MILSGGGIHIPGTGGGGGVAAPSTPASIITSVPVVHWYRADLGVTTAAGKVTEWRDQIGTAHLAQASAPLQPAYTAADPTFSNLATIASTAVGAGGQFLATPGVDFTGPVFVLSVVKLILEFNSGGIYSRGGYSGDGALLQTFGVDIYQSGPSFNANTDFGAVTPLKGNWARFRDRRQNNAADYIKLGNRAKVTGTACPPCVNPLQPFFLFGWTPGGNTVQAAFREIVVCAGEPSAAELTAIDAYFAAQSAMLQ